MKSGTTLFSIIAILLLGCNNDSHSDTEIKILNSNFLAITDTLAYKYNTLRPPGNYDTIVQNDILPITVYYKLININESAPDIVHALRNAKFIEATQYLTLLNENDKDTASIIIDNASLNNFGKFQITLTKNRDFFKMEGYIGHIQFSRIIFNEKLAMMTATIKDNIKSGVDKLVLFKKNSKGWEIYKEIELVIW